MKYISAFSNAVPYTFQLISKRNLLPYFTPAAAIAVLFYLSITGSTKAVSYLDAVEDWIIIGWLFSTSKSIIAFLAFMLFEFLILVLLSPVNSYFAEQTHEDITGKKIDFSFQLFLKALGRMLMILMVATIVQLIIAFVLWLFSFVFGDFFYTLASMLNISFFVGFSFFDFALELDGKSSGKSWKFARKNWIACILLGLIFNLGIYYPQEHGWFIIYLVAIVILPHILTIIASKMYYELTDKKPYSETTQNSHQL